MDTGEGMFMQVNDKDPKELKDLLGELQKEYPKHGGTFYVGQNLELNGSKFRILAITKKTILLKLLPKG